ncbi:MAG: endonuclease VII domain-containing protein [Actinobacteria bacterium]|nr:endonuclease VII domain-containing protein [Actinomycetota bacterium]
MQKDRERHYADYGLTLVELREMLTAQGGRCAICNAAFDEDLVPNVDHCHETGRVRGLLCHHCNTGMGLLRDDPARLRSAARYLEDAASQEA